MKKLIDKQSELVEHFRAEDEKHWSHALGTTIIDGQNYWDAADKLANMLIQYKMLSDAQVNDYTDVKFSNDGNEASNDRDVLTLSDSATMVLCCSDWAVLAEVDWLSSSYLTVSAHLCRWKLLRLYLHPTVCLL